MLKKTKLYFDLVRRLTLTQIYYLFKNRIKTKLIPSVFNRKRVKKIDYIKFQEFLTNAKRIVYIQEDSIPIWSAQREISREKQHYYFNDLNSLLKIEQQTSEEPIRTLETIWKENPYHLEINNNYQRFQLFNEIFYEQSIVIKLRLDIILSWINLNLPSTNIAWNSFNCTIRLLNWLKILVAIPQDYVIDDNKWRLIQKSIFFQCQYICRNIEYHIPGNHILIQFIVLSIITKLFPFWVIDCNKLNDVDTVVEREILNQFTEEGFHFEHSYHYHLQMTIFILLWLHFVQLSVYKVNEKVYHIIKRAGALLEDFILPGDIIPMLSDNCFSFLTKNSEEDIWLARKLYTIVLNESLIEDNQKKSVKINNHYYIVKSGQSKLIFDIGNIGTYNNPGHGHSDILSIIYVWNSIPIFIDPGTKRYDNNEEDLLLKRAILHNTITVDSSDQAELWGFFRWARLPNKLNHFMMKTNSGYTLRGEYKGFYKLGGYKHSREIEFENQSLNITDNIDGKGNRNLISSFILHNEIDCEIDSSNIILLKNKERILKMDLFSKSTHYLKIAKITLYPVYDLGVESKLVQIHFQNVKFPFNSRISIIPIEK